jgi:hypothetical protein
MNCLNTYRAVLIALKSLILKQKMKRQIYISFFSTVTDLINALPCNGSVNTHQRATMEAVSQWTNVIARC